MLQHLIPSRRALSGADIIFALNAEARRRQAAGEAVVNATLGALADDAGRLVIHPPVMELWRALSPEEVAPYAPIAGDPASLAALVRRAFPGAPEGGAGCITPGGSGALALTLRNFLEPGMRVLAAGPWWGPYRTLAQENGMGLAGAPFPLPGQALDIAAWRRAAEDLMGAQGRLLVWLNDPCHNPTGRALAAADRAVLGALLEELAGRGPVILALDCAYLDYAGDPAAVAAALADYAGWGWAGRILVGACLSVSKALTLYGARCGALAFPWCDDPRLQAALAQSCRGSFSNCPRAPQSLLVRLANDPLLTAALAEEHARWRGVLAARAAALDAALVGRGLAPLGWQGGFFVTWLTADAEAVAERLKARNVFVVPMPGEGLRIGICALPEAQAGQMADALADCL